jgi:hypothetical protein
MSPATPDAEGSYVYSVALVTLSADSVHTLFPAHDANTYKLWGLLVSVPRTPAA